MKFILTTIVFLSLAISGVAQTRNVIVNTNGVIQSPTNFWSADVTNARSGLGLGTAATNPASAFQPSSATLSNLSSGNGSGLTNVTASSISSALAISNTTGLQSALDSKLATNGNTTGTASNVTGVVSLANGGTGGSNASTARAGLGASFVGANIFTVPAQYQEVYLRINADNTVSSLSASNFRTAIGASATVGTVTSVGMTVPAIFSLSTPTITSSGTFALTLANQTSRQVLIAPNGGGVPAFRGVESDDLPSLAISKITGLQTALDGKLATNGTATLANNVTGVVALANGGTGGTDAATARTGLGATTAGSSMFTLVNPSAIRFLRLNNDNTMSALSDSDFRTAIGLGTAATNPATVFQPSSLALSNLASSNGGALTNLTAANITGAVAITNGGSGATTAGGARTNLGGTAVGNSVFTAINAATAATAIGLGTTNDVSFSTVTSTFVATVGGLNGTALAPTGIQFNGVAAAITRTNLGLGWAALTNTSTAGFSTSLYGSGTNPVLYNTNGEVVSPTNFWQNVPSGLFANAFQNLNLDNFSVTNNATNAANLLVYSIASNVGNITNTINLPTNGSSGNIATIVHTGPTNSVTAIRKTGGTNLITLNKTGESVRFVYDGTNWSSVTALSFTEPVFFVGTNAVANAATSRTNLGLGGANTVTFSNLQLQGSGSLGIGGMELEAPDSGLDFAFKRTGITNMVLKTNGLVLHVGSYSFSSGNTGGAPTTRTNLGLGATWLTNTNVSNFRTDIGLGATWLTNTSASSFRTAIGALATNGNGSNITDLSADNITTGIVLLTNGGTGGSNAATARTNIGLGNGINTNFTFLDVGSNTHDIIITNGIITQWDVY